ncbi:MAG: ribonuclease J [Patescibacteria group bacterium]
MITKIKRESEKGNYSPRKTDANVDKSETLRLVPLGGLEEIGRNMMYLEYKDEIVIIDMGLQFPEEETPGIDYIIPNIESLEHKKKNIRAVIITHGHYDHIGAIPYLMGKLGNPTLYTAKLTKAIIEKRQEEFVNAPKLNIVSIEDGYKAKIGEYFDVEFITVEHTIPDSTGVIIKTPVGNIAHLGDFRIDYTEDGKANGLDAIKRVGDMGIHTFMSDSTNAEEPGKTISERLVEKNLEILFKAAKGRIILTTFASMITRIAEIIKIAEKMGKKVLVNGRSMKDNIQICQNMGYINAKKGTLISPDEINKHKDDKLLIITTGAQGESRAGLMRIVSGEHKHIRIKAGDTMIFSSSVIPGNERSVQVLKDNIIRQGAIVHQTNIIDIHVSGHAPAGDLTMVTKLLRPKFVMPVHGYYFMRVANGRNSVEGGVDKENIRLMDNGQVAELTKDDFVITDETVPAYYVMVDGLGVGDVGEIVLRDRKLLAQEGMLVVIATVDRKTGRIIKNPDIISRGFIYLKDNQGMLDEIRTKIKNIINRIPRPQQVDPDYLKTIFRDQIGQYVYNKTYRRPMILPVIIEV